MRAIRAVAAIAGLLLLVSACSEPVDVTDSAGTTAPASAPAEPAGGGDVPPELRGALPACPESSDAAEVPDGLPNDALACLGPGGPVRLSGLRGTPLVLNVWASWCQPCRSELPALAEFASQSGDAVSVLGLDAMDDAGAAAALWSQLAMPFPSVADPTGTTRPDLTWVGLPVTYFVDADGTIVYRHAGAVTDPDEWASLARKHLSIG